MNTISGITMETKAPAVNRCHSPPREPAISESRWVIGADCSVPPEKVSATSRSFQIQRNWKIAMEASAGITSGRAIRRKIFPWPAPSTLAASIRSLGSSDMKLWMR